jgi:hypothetical protein
MNPYSGAKICTKLVQTCSLRLGSKNGQFPVPVLTSGNLGSKPPKTVSVDGTI